jgi:hypothetical protein
MRGFIAGSLQFVAHRIAYTRCNLQRGGRVPSLFPLKIPSETCRARPYEHTAKPVSCCRPNQFRCSALQVLLQDTLRQFKAGLVRVAVMAHVCLARIAQADFALESPFRPQAMFNPNSKTENLKRTFASENGGRNHRKQ